MVLVERLQGKPATDSGLFVPRDNLPTLHLCKVISMGPGREEENGRIAPMPNIKKGDVVIAKNLGVLDRKMRRQLMERN
ncbi:hypothetical protein QTG54_004260 [Skeletonema marinoi]|uniref:Uncharacterized protein n=1 Tax=Skeletonema marinoi TaxID=267567 RepID=A0AAD8YED1_9STRA|nr:hypothetical protein QTG54_004260 [Skeletonema marinoi]